MKQIIFVLLLLFSFQICFSQVDSMLVELSNGTIVSYAIPAIREITFSGNLTDVQDQELISKIINSFTLRQNYPNPFNPTTTISFEIPRVGIVLINIYDINGRLIRSYGSSKQSAGIHTFIWDGRNSSGVSVSSGTYFCQVHFNDSYLTNKLVLIK
jgi:hypothetical protein